MSDTILWAAYLGGLAALVTNAIGRRVQAELNAGRAPLMLAAILNVIVWPLLALWLLGLGVLWCVERITGERPS